MAEARSLAIGIHLAGIQEIVVLMHTDCGCCVAYSKVDTIIERMNENLTPSQNETFRQTTGEPFQENLRNWLKAFEEPRSAIQQEVTTIKSLSFVPETVVVHGLLYDLATGGIEVVVNGYEAA